MKKLLEIFVIQAVILASFVTNVVFGFDLDIGIAGFAFLSAVLVLRYPSNNEGVLGFGDFRMLWDCSKLLVIVCLLQVAIVVMCFFSSSVLLQAGYAALLFGVPILSMAIVGYCMVTSVKSRA